MHLRLELAPRLLVVALFVTCACGVGPPNTPPATPTPQPALTLKIADGAAPPAALPQSVVMLAAQRGFFQREGLDVTVDELTGTPTVITAMRAGDVDVGIINGSDVIKLDAQQALDLRVIGSPNGRSFWMIVSRDNIAALNDLRGQAYAISRVGSEDHSLAMTVLAARGIERSEINFIALGIPTVRVQALLANQIAATTTTIATWSTIRSQPGVKVLLGPDDFWNTAPVMSNVSAVTVAVERDKAEALRRYTRGVLQAARYYAQHKEDWVRDMGALRPDILPVDLADLWDQFGPAWAVNGQLNLSTFQQTTDFYYGTADFKELPRIQLNDWIDTQFVDGALSQLGIYPGVDDPGRPIH